MMGEQAQDVRFRQARPGDRPRLREICLQTGDGGGDARDREDDPDLLGLIFVEPYVIFAPNCSVIAEADNRILGYAVGVPDSGAFLSWMAETWLPPLRTGRADPGPDRSRWSGSDWLRHRLHHPPLAPDPALAGFPAHGHIDLAPEAQGQGLGRPLMARMMQALAGAGALALHLGVDPANHRALGFYARLGFAPIAVPGDPETAYLGRVLP